VRDALIAGVVFAWTTLVLICDGSGTLTEQRLFGLATWGLLALFLAGERPLVRAQVAVVVAFATAVEYTFAPLLGVYSYRFDNVPAYVPPGHGLVYLCALALGRTAWVHRHRRGLRTGVVAVGCAYAGWGLLLADRVDVLGAFWFACLIGFLYLGRSQTLYLGAFAIVTYLELVGTAAGTWAWSTHDPTGVIPIGNPPSGAAGGYGWFDLAALWLAPALLSGCSAARDVGWRWARAAGCRRPLLATALPPSGPGRPSRSVNVPPASDTITASGARSCSATSGSAARSTVPSASKT
jgi:hypothetical protein